MSNTTNDKMKVNMSNMLSILNGNPHHPNPPPNPSYIPPSNSSQNLNLSPWISQTRDSLIKTEQRNISTRIERWTNIVNDSAQLMSKKLSFTDAQLPLPVFTLKDLPPAQYLNYIMEWNPLDMNQLTKMETFEECAQNGRDWLNTRKGQKYGLTLFPDLIRFAAKHSSNLARFLYGNHNRHREMYSRALMYQCIYHLFDSRIPDVAASKTVNLLCLESIKINPNQSQQNTIAQVIAGYAEDPQFYCKYATHDLKAKFFSSKFKKQLSELHKSLDNHRRTKPDKKSPSAPPLPPPPPTNESTKDNDDVQSAASSVFSASSTHSTKHRNEDVRMAGSSLPAMPSLQKPPNETNSNNNKRASSSTPNSSSISANVGNMNKTDGSVQGCKTEKTDTPSPTANDTNPNETNHRSHSHQNMNTRLNMNPNNNNMNAINPNNNNNNMNGMNKNMNTNMNPQRNNIFIATNSTHSTPHMNSMSHNSNQINQLLQTMASTPLNNNNNNGNKSSNGNKSNGNKPIMITQMMNNNNITTNQVNQMPIVTFTNQQHKMILHLLNQLISTYNRQQMNIVYLNNRVQQLECALAKQTAKVEAIELKASNNNGGVSSRGGNRAKKHKHAHHRHHSHNGNGNMPNSVPNGANNRNMANTPVTTPTSSVNNNNAQYQYKQPKFQGSRAPKGANNMTVLGAPNSGNNPIPNGPNNGNKAQANSINMQNVDAMSAKKILRAHGIELQQLLNLVKHIPQNQMRNGMNAMNPQRATNNNQNTPNNNPQNNNNNIIVNGNPNINQIQMRIPITSSSSNGNTANGNNNNLPPPTNSNFNIAMQQNKNKNNNLPPQCNNNLPPQTNSNMNMNAMNAAMNGNNNNNGNGNWQGILNILSTLGNGQNVPPNGAGNMNINNLVVRNRGNVPTNNMNMNAMRPNTPSNNSPQNQMNAMNTMNGIATLGKSGNNMNNMNNMNRHNAQNMNMNRAPMNPPSNVAALMVPSLPKLNAPNPNMGNMPPNPNNNNVNNNNNNVMMKESKIKIKKQQMKPQPSILGVPQPQGNRKRNNRNDPTAVNMNNASNQPPTKKRKVDDNNNNNNNMNALNPMNMNTMSTMNNMSNMNTNMNSNVMNMNPNNPNNNNNNSNVNIGNIMNNPMMIQMLLAQISNGNGSQSQNQ